MGYWALGSQMRWALRRLIPLLLSKLRVALSQGTVLNYRQVVFEERSPTNTLVFIGLR
ncbi:hypothetical protein [Nostoc sp.]|uniref:hypothetical protein n=1 Tax=Nostoc sp. TaxID=1180 RepID=UPI002FF46A99